MSERKEEGFLERELRSALGRVEPPEGFARRVAARAFEDRQAQAARRGWWQVVAASFLLGSMCGGWLVHRDREDRRQASVTQGEFRMAMRVTARVTERSLTEAKRRINQTEAAEGESR